MSHDIISTIPTRGRIHGDTHTHPQASTELTCHASIVCIEYLLGREAGSAQKIGKQIARQTNTQINRYRAAYYAVQAKMLLVHRILYYTPDSETNKRSQHY